MARKLRLQFPGAIYHVLSRGDHRETIFRDDRDRDLFLQTLADACGKTSWQVHAFCLMPNHFHLIVETPQPNLAVGMKWFLGTYTTRFNWRHGLTGHVFAGRYKSLLVGGQGGYLRTACDYVHLNPVRAKLLSSEMALRTYRWSSFHLYIASTDQRPGWLRVDRLFGECGFSDESAAGRRHFEQRLEARRRAESDEEFAPMRRGWCFGDGQFRQELLSQIEGHAGRYHYGNEIQEASEAKADRIVAEELRRAVWTEAELALRRKGDPAKIAIARRLRRETSVTMRWIAARLHMGTQSHLSHLLYWLRRAEKENKTLVSAREATEHSTLAKPSTVTKARAQRKPPAMSEPRSQAEKKAGPIVNPCAGGNNNTLPLTDPLVFDPVFD